MTRMSSGLEIGPRLGSIRAQRRMSQGTLSRLAGIAPSHLSRIENGRIQPTFPTLWKLLRALRADFDELLAADAPPASKGSCPVSPRGECLLASIRSDAEVARDRRRMFYSTREIAILRELAEWLKSANPDSVRALEVVLEDLFTRPTKEGAAS